MEICKNDVFIKEMDRLHMGVSYAARAVLEPGWSFIGENPTFTRVYCVLSGTGTVFCGGRAVPMQPGNIYILPAGLDFSYTIQETMDKVYFHVNLLRYDRYDLMQCVHHCIVLPNREREIEKVALLMKDTADMMSVLQLKQLLYTLLIEGIEAGDGKAGMVEQYSPLVKKAIRYMEAHMYSGMTSAEVAAALFVSDSQLRKTFRREVGVPIGRYITDRLLFVAEQQLRLTGRTVKDISSELGFCDAFYFSRMFSARYGVSPTVYRNLRCRG